MSCRAERSCHSQNQGWIGICYPIALVERLALILERNLSAGISAQGLIAEVIANDTGSNPDAALVARDGANSPLQG